MLRSLLCGNRYQLYMTAYNRIGTGLPCDIVHTATRGSSTCCGFNSNRHRENFFFERLL